MASQAPTEGGRCTLRGPQKGTQSRPWVLRDSPAASEVHAPTPCPHSPALGAQLLQMDQAGPPSLGSRPGGLVTRENSSPSMVLVGVWTDDDFQLSLGSRICLLQGGTRKLAFQNTCTERKQICDSEGLEQDRGTS